MAYITQIGHRKMRWALFSVFPEVIHVMSLYRTDPACSRIKCFTDISGQNIR